MFRRPSPKIRPGAALAGALCLTLILGSNTVALATDSEPSPQPEVSTEAGGNAQPQSDLQSGGASDEESNTPGATGQPTSDAPANPAPAAEVQPALPAPSSPFRNARAANANELDVSLTVKADGTADFDQNDDAGNDSGATNGIVRVNDTITYTLQYKASVGAAENFTAKIVFPKGVYMTELPGTCAQPGSSLTPADPTANVTLPLSENSRDQLQEQTLLCNLGHTETSALRVDLVARVSNLVHHGQALAIQAVSATADNVAEVPTKAPLPSVNASAALKWDVSKNSMSTKDGLGYAYGPAVENCFWDPTRACFATRYNLLISSAAGGKGAMPAIGDVVIQDDLRPETIFKKIDRNTPGLTPDQINQVNANLEKYGSRVMPAETYYGMPGRKIGESSNGILNTVENSVRDSGTLELAQPAGPGTPVTLTVKGADFSLRTYPSKAVRPNNEAVPANRAYAVAHTFIVHTPADIVRDFGVVAGGERVLSLRNTYTGFSAQGFAPSDRQTTDVYEGNNWLPKTLKIGTPGDFNKYFGGDVGNPANSTPEEFSAGNGWVGEGLPGGGTYRSGDTGVASGQDVVALVRGVAASPLYDFTGSTIVCDAWDNSKLYLKEKDWKGAVYGSRQGVPTGYGRGVASNGKAVWISGYNNVLLPSGTSTTDAISADQVPALKVQYSAVPGGKGAASACGNDKGPWYDTPGEVPGNDPQKAAKGVYTAVSRARAYFVSPPVVGLFSSIGNGYSMNVAFGFEVAPGLEPGTVIPNWASAKRVMSTDNITYSMEEVLANASAPWSESGYDPGTSLTTGNTGALGDRLIASDVYVRVAKKVRKGADGAFSSTPPAVGGGDRVDFEIAPSINSSASVPGIQRNVWVEDCLPSSLSFVSASRTPDLVLIGQNPQDIKRNECAPGDTYIRWVYPAAEANAVLDPIIVTTEVYDTATDGNYVNHVQIWGEGDASPVAKRQASANISVTNKTGLKLAKIALTPVLQVNLPGAAERDAHRWRVLLTNTAPAGELAVESPSVIDVLPKVGVNNTQYHGTFTFDSFVPKSADSAQWQVHYTKTDSAQVNPDPKHASNLQGGATVWCDAAEGGQIVNGAAGECPASKADVTAIRVTRPGAFPQGSSIDFEVSLIGEGNHANENYVNRVAASAENLTFTVGPLDRVETTIASSIGDKFWIDADGNGLFDDGEAGVPDATVTLTGIDDKGNPVRLTTTTSADGTYSFPALRASDSGGYTLHFEIPDALKAQKYEFTAPDQGNKEDLDSDANAQGTTVPVRLGEGESNLNVDAGLVAPAITLVKEADRTEVAAGDVITYTFTATNTGSAPLGNVQLTEDSFTNGRGQKITLDAQPAIQVDQSTGTADNMAPGQKIVWTATYTVKADDLELGAFINNAASVTGDSPAGTTVKDTADKRIPPKGDGTYTVSKTANLPNGRELNPGDTITYTVTVTHVGDLPVRAAKVADSLAAVLDDADYNNDLNVSTSGAPGAAAGTGQVAGNVLSWQGDLVKNQVVTLTYSVTTKSGGDRAINNAVTHDNHPKGQCDNNVGCETNHRIAQGKYTYSKIADVPSGTEVKSGQKIDYTITVKHAGGDTVTGASIEDDLTNILENAVLELDTLAASSGKVSFNGRDKKIQWTGDLAHNVATPVTITFSVTVRAEGGAVLTNRVTSADPDTKRHSCDDTVGCRTSHTVPAGKYTYSKVADPASGSVVRSGDVITYTIAVKHTEGDRVKDASVKDDFSALLAHASYNKDAKVKSGNGTVEVDNGVLTWTGDLAEGATEEITFSVTVNANGGATLVNTLTSEDPKTDRHSCDAAVGCQTTHTVPKGEYTYSKTANPVSGSVVKSDDTITYTIAVKHSGGDRVKNATITDNFSEVLKHATYLNDATVKSGNGTLEPVVNGVLKWTGDLAVGATEEITFSVRVDAEQGATLVNTLTSEDPDATRHSCDTAVGCQTTHTVQQGSFTYSKSADVANNAAVVSGDRITYTLTATHAGGDRVKDAFFTDDLTEILKHATPVGEPAVKGPGVARFLKDPNNDQKVTGVEWRGTLNDTTAREAVVTFTVEVDTDAVVTLTNTLGTTDPRGTCVADGMCRTDHTVPEGSFVYSKVANVANGEKVYSGDALNYTINVRHTGGNRIKKATISDDLSALLKHLDVKRNEVTASIGEITWQGDILTWTGDLDGKTAPSATITIPTIVNAQQGATLTNTVTSTHPRGGCDDAVGCETTHTVPGGTFTYSKVASAPNNEKVYSGDTIEYTLNVAHREGDRVLGASITDNFTSLLANATYNNDAKASAGTVNVKDGVLTWTGDLDRGAKASITFSVTLDAQGEATLTNEVTSTDARGTCDDALGCVTTHTVPAGKFIYSKTAQVPSGATVKKGDTITYTLKVRHADGDRILGATIVDDLAKVLPYASYLGDVKTDLGTVEYKEGKLHWMGDLARKAEATITFSVKVTADQAASVVNTVTTTPENAQRSSCDTAIGCETTHKLVASEKPSSKGKIPATGSIAQTVTGVAALFMGAGVIALAGLRRRRQH